MTYRLQLLPDTDRYQQAIRLVPPSCHPRATSVPPIHTALSTAHSCSRTLTGTPQAMYHARTTLVPRAYHARTTLVPRLYHPPTHTAPSPLTAAPGLNTHPYMHDSLICTLIGAPQAVHLADTGFRTESWQVNTATTSTLFLDRFSCFSESQPCTIREVEKSKWNCRSSSSSGDSGDFGGGDSWKRNRSR